MPVEIGSFEVGKLGDPESRVEQDPDNEFLFVGVASVGQAGCLVCRERFAFVLVAHGGVVKGGRSRLEVRCGCRKFSRIATHCRNLTRASYRK